MKQNTYSQCRGFRLGGNERCFERASAEGVYTQYMTDGDRHYSNNAENPSARSIIWRCVVGGSFLWLLTACHQEPMATTATESAAATQAADTTPTDLEPEPSLVCNGVNC